MATQHYSCILKGHLLLLSLSVLDPPHTELTHTSAWKPTESQSVTLTCVVTGGNPSGDIKNIMWKKGDNTLPTSSRYQFDNSKHVLRIYSLNHTLDDGNYSCAATNDVGTGKFSEQVQLQIRCKCLQTTVKNWLLVD